LNKGAGKAGSRLAPVDRYAKGRLRVLLHSGEQGNRRHPGLPCAVVGTAYVVLSSGALHYCPVALRMTDAANPVGPPHHHKT